MQRRATAFQSRSAPAWINSSTTGDSSSPLTGGSGSYLALCTVTKIQALLGGAAESWQDAEVLAHLCHKGLKLFS